MPKYFTYKSYDFTRVAIFDEAQKHDNVWSDMGSPKLIGAGFFVLQQDQRRIRAVPYGKSHTLNVGKHKDDQFVLEMALGLLKD